MKHYSCEYCGTVFDPVKRGVCPHCGAALSADAAARIQREQTESQERLDRMKEDIVRRHERETRNGQYDMPRQLSNASRSPFRTGIPRRPQKACPPALKLGIVVVGVLMACLCLWRLRVMLNGNAAEERAAGSETVLPPEETQFGGLGDGLRWGDFEVTAVAIRDYDAKGYETMNLSQGFQIVAVELQVRNISSTKVKMENVWGLALDENGNNLVTNQHAPNDTERPNSLFTGWLCPGSVQVGRLFYEIPTDAAVLELHFGAGIVFSIPLS